MLLGACIVLFIRMAKYGCDIPEFLNNHYPMYTAIGLDANPDVTAANAVKLERLVTQFQGVIPGSVDMSNKGATFEIVPNEIEADAQILQALVALLG